jgi:hypothetical protein
MTMRPLLAAALLLATAAASAAPATYLIVDHSSAALMDKAGALASWKAQMDDKRMARIAKLYPVGKWGFISQVEGGFTADKACVVTARAMLVPRVLGSRLVFQPAKSATTFGTAANASAEQCKALAADKLKEAITSVDSALAAR